MSNKLIPFDAATFDPKKYRLKWGNEYVELYNGKEVPDSLDGVLVITKGAIREFHSDGRYRHYEPVTLFMEPIEPEGEESCWTKDDLITEISEWKFNSINWQHQAQALEKERDELKADRDNWKQCHTAEVKNADNWNEKCCQAEDQAALWEKRYNELMAISHKQPPPPATIPFSWEKYKEGYECQTESGIPVEKIWVSSDGENMLVEMHDGRRYDYTIYGSYNDPTADEPESNLVLIPPAPVEEVRYINVYKAACHENLQQTKDASCLNATQLKLTFQNNICTSAEPVKL